MDKKDNHIGTISLIFVIALACIILIRIAMLQASSGIERKRYSDPVVSSSLVRGTIYDRNGNILAIQAPDYGFYVHITSSSPSYVASIIAPYLSYDALEIEQMINDGETFFPLSYVPTKEEGEYLKRLIVNLALEDELDIELREVRKYTSKSSTWKIVGSVDEYLNGISGIEKLYNNILEARPKLGRANVNGTSIILTLDIDIQFALERIPAISDYDKSTIAILSSNKEILAYHGEINDNLLASLVYSFVNEEETAINNRESYFDSSELIGLDNYFVYIEAPDESTRESILGGIRSLLSGQGRIKTIS